MPTSPPAAGSAHVSSDYKRGYSKGYAAASRGAWHEWKPPAPPHEQVRAIMDAARKLRDAAADICGSLMEDDEFTLKLQPRIDAVDEAMIAVANWLNTQPVPQ